MGAAAVRVADRRTSGGRARISQVGEPSFRIVGGRPPPRGWIVWSSETRLARSTSRGKKERTHGYAKPEVPPPPNWGIPGAPKWATADAVATADDSTWFSKMH